MADPKRDGVRPAEAWLSRLIGETPADADEKATAQLWLAALRAMQAESFAAGHAAGQADMRERAAEAMQRRGYTMLAVDISKLPISPARTTSKATERDPHPWAAFLYARARVLRWFQEEYSETPEQMVAHLAMDPVQVALILETPLESSATHPPAGTRPAGGGE